MSTTPQKQAIARYRKRLSQRGMERFEVLGSPRDRELLRAIARRLAVDGPDSAGIRAAIRQAVSPEPSLKGGILAALCRSPLVGAHLEIKRPRSRGRKVEL